jgi:hypothetical protein
MVLIGSVLLLLVALALAVPGVDLSRTAAAHENPVELIRALIIVAGLGAVVAAALGWLNGGLTVRTLTRF